MDLHNDPQLLANFLSPAEIENIPPEVQKKLQKYVNDILDDYCKHKVAANRLGKSSISLFSFLSFLVDKWKVY